MGAYAVLATVSRGYSVLLGRFPRDTHPFATKVTGASSGPSFDLHVLGMPPAFVLSQDQTLKFDFLLARTIVELGTQRAVLKLTESQKARTAECI